VASSYADWAARWRVPLHFVVAVVALVFARPTPALLAITVEEVAGAVNQALEASGGK